MKIRIESQDKIWVRMLELKLESDGFEIAHGDETAGALLIDLDTVGTVPPEGIRCAVGFTRKPIGPDENRLPGWERFHAILHRPCATETVIALLKNAEDAGEIPSRDVLPGAVSPSSGDLRLSEEEQALYVGDHKIPLSPHETVICRRLLQTPGEPVSRETLRALFLSPEESDSNLADVYICHIRQKAEKICHVRLIRTVRGKGYQIG